ncbi:MAG: YggT family protein [Patescibacteria group bacterium]|nr:YggT family protein [Patescibacteria group bacterium]
MYYPILFINYFFQILTFLVIARVILSWFRTPHSSPIYRFLIDSTQPVMNLAKKITPRTAMLDFSPIVAIIGLDLARTAVLYILASL